MSVKLDNLVSSGCLAEYWIENLDEEGKIGKSQFRNTERLTLVFPNGQQLVVGTLCSGTAEDTFFTFEERYVTPTDA